jgi:hypothetical protein
MIAGIRTAVRTHPYLSASFALALALTLFFAIRAATFALYWADPAHRNQPIAGWMTPRYVAHSWALPPKVLRAALGPAAPEPGDRRTLADLARDTGIPLETLIADLEAAAAAHRASEQ